MSMTYTGKVLHIDLSSTAVKESVLPAAVYEKYLGGMGLANWLASQFVGSNPDVFSGDNPVIVAGGALAGTPAPSTSRTTAVTLMPLNRAWGSANGGGNFSARLRWAGYDAVVITGKAASPVYLVIDDQVTISPAEDLWGKGILETTEILWRRHPDSSVMAIGPAGERKIFFALSMIDNMATLGRGGLGAVLGDKRLKGIAVKGTKLPSLADKGRFLALSRKVHDRLKNISWRDQWLKQGIYLGWPVWKQELVTDNFQRRLPRAQIEKLGPQMYSRHYVRPLACLSCPMADKAVVEVGGCSYPVSYGLHGALSGARWGAPDEAAALKMMIEANDQGVDDLTLFAVAGWAIDLFREGIITAADTEGQVLQHTPDNYRKLVRQIIQRQGIGNVLAEGFLANFERFGKEAANLAVHIKGVDPISDPRPHSSGFLFAQLTNPRGAYVVQGNSPAFNPGKSSTSLRRFLTSIGVRDEKAATIAPDGQELDLALLVRHTEDWYAAASSLGFCARQPVMQSYDPDTAAGLIAAATGMEMDARRLLTAGERVWNQYRLNNHHWNATDDNLPDMLYRELLTPEGESLGLKNYEQTRPLKERDIQASLRRYYRDRGWDNNGLPTKETLERLQLSPVGGNS